MKVWNKRRLPWPVTAIPVRYSQKSTDRKFLPARHLHSSVPDVRFDVWWNPSAFCKSFDQIVEVVWICGSNSDLTPWNCTRKISAHLVGICIDGIYGVVCIADVIFWTWSVGQHLNWPDPFADAQWLYGKLYLQDSPCNSSLPKKGVKS